MRNPHDFWRHSGFHLLARREDGRLCVTEDFLRAYLLRPEIRPVEESGQGELALHQRLMDEPDLALGDSDLSAIEDADTRDNYRLWLRFRDRLLGSETIEACYLGLFAGKGMDVPPLFVEQLAHILVRNVLHGLSDSAEDALQVRAAELFFREQKATLRDGQVLLADAETIAQHASGAAYGSLGRLLVEAQTPLGGASLDVLDLANAGRYWARDERHDFVIAARHDAAAMAALSRVIEKWLAHMAGLQVTVQPVAAIEDAHWSWHIGLDVESSSLLDALWRGESVEQGRMRRLAVLFRMQFNDASLMRPALAGKPVYLALSMDEQEQVRFKPQNLLINLPLIKPLIHVATAPA